MSQQSKMTKQRKYMNSNLNSCASLHTISKTPDPNFASIGGTHVSLKPLSVNWSKRMEKNEKRRRKQVDIFYRTGRPIFKITKDNQYLRRFSDPLYYTEQPVWI